MAPVGPDDCEASAIDVQIEPGERSDQPGGSDYSMHAELDDAFTVETLATPLAADGLPDHSVDGSPDGVPAFTIDNVCCIEDESQYVEMFYDEICDSDYAAIDYRAGVTARTRFDDEGRERQRRTFLPAEVHVRWGQTVALASGPDRPQWVAVKPVRPRCQFYKRQMFANDDQPDPTEPGHRLVFRVCTHPARRSIGGAAMSLRDQAVYSCDFRDPVDPKSAALLDAFDAKKIEERPDLVRLPLFNMPGEVVVVPRGSS